MVEVRGELGDDPQFISENTVDTYAESIVRYRNISYRDGVMRQYQDAQKRYEQQRRRQEADERQQCGRRNSTRSAARRDNRSMSPPRDRVVQNTRRRESRPAPSALAPPIEPVGPHAQVAFILSEVFRNAMSPEALNNNNTNMTTALLNMLNTLGLTRENIQKLDYLFIPFHHWENQHFFLMGLAPKQGFVFLIDSCTNTYPKNTYPVQSLLALALYVCPLDVSWPMYGNWSSREWQEDESPNCARQGDWHNCGVFTCTNMLCLAFGYRLMCYKNRDLDISKRHRMAAELLADGFGTPPFDYQLFDLPTAIEAHREDYEWNPAGTIAVRGYTTLFRSSSTRIPLRLIPEDDPMYAPDPEVEDHWPDQFSTRYHSKAGFVYSTPLNISTVHTRSRSSIIEACIMYGVKDYELWSREPLDMFRRWFLNEIAGQIGRSRGGLVPMGSGDDVHAKAKADRAAMEGERNRRMNKVKDVRIRK